MAESSPTFDAALEALRAEPAAYAWRMRLGLAKATVAAVEKGDNGDSALPLFKLLATDPKWEVRKEIADHLHLLDDGQFAAVAGPLTEDSNAFVKKAAELALARRKRGEVAQLKRKRGLDTVESDLRRLEKSHGEPAARAAQVIAQRLYEVLIGTTVHDMRGIFTSLKAHTETLIRSVGSEEGAAAAVMQLGPRMRDMIAFTERLLDDMRTFTQMLPADRHRERLADLVTNAVSLAREELAGTGRDPSAIEVRADVPSSLSPEVSRVQIVLAIKNLVKNAHESFALDPRHFRPGRVEVVAKPLDEERIEIVIADNGSGLSPDDLAEVRRFLPGKTSKKYLGTGFGLPIAKRNIEGHGGSISVESREGEGTRVTVRLPIEAREGRAA